MLAYVGRGHISRYRGGDMSRTANCILLGIACIASAVGWAQTSASKGASSLTIIFKDGHQTTYADVSRIDFKSPGAMILTRGGREERLTLAEVSHIDFNPSAAFQIGRNHFVGKWKVGTGGGEDFLSRSIATVRLERLSVQPTVPGKWSTGKLVSVGKMAGTT